MLRYGLIWIWFSRHTQIFMTYFFWEEQKEAKLVLWWFIALLLFPSILDFCTEIWERANTLLCCTLPITYYFILSYAYNWIFSPAITPNMSLLSRFAATTTVARNLAGAVRIRCIRCSRRMTADGRAFSRRRRSRKSRRESTLRK